MSPGCGGGCCGPEAPPGVTTDLLVADPRDATAVAEATAPRARWAGIDARGVDQVKLGTLWALLAGREYRDELVLEFVPLHEVSEDGPWVFRVPDPLVALLADVDDAGASRAAPAWAATDELALDGWDAEGAAALIDGLRGLARGARAGGKPLLMRVSL
jgi:hypothetical protein